MNCFRFCMVRRLVECVREKREYKKRAEGRRQDAPTPRRLREHDSRIAMRANNRSMGRAKLTDFLPRRARTPPTCSR
jgi:hypothetical protein